ncbi:dihydroorotase [Yersinia enterocolitica]|uniref:Amidohydrolase-related domain-containing protein n=1 Tax=Yersinia enterocolitica serotype O:8 / biotype 1B (strain NCTC 13174 / 8081) TaxID=393305 RepID=A1JRF6_YERE8|nr:amidohydrolase/deacetylase family metallohydrolase [Yersinia enterocolitica]AJJ22215.1 amidohydrolase family protein [Yersinia enterocolitica]ELI8283055.1 amidohydrolase/deacetylase family metallohydrolase [Yersinia enterocolitica]KGA78020.1 amidohydrolase family protein [Yersinia enterocolitica]MCE3128999.1 amidohydrolase/deacetylase family metallohydrolase [Yersinia enterocolitica]PNM20142.1 amidohydrolase/deacetylase family metallohydrolase [Yersinia enterocolitica]
MYDFIITGALLVDGRQVDIAINNGKIVAVSAAITEDKENQTKSQIYSAKKVLDLAGKYYLSAGWIDSHVHCYPASPIYHDEADLVGVGSGVTTVVDAGSTGANDVDDFYRLTRAAKTHVYAFLNIAKTGIATQNELADMAQIDKQSVTEAIARNPGFILGIKARMSSSVVGKNGIKPLVRAKEIQQENNQLPLMVHIGNNPPDLDEIADLLTQGDIITHCYNGKPNRILTPAGALRESIQRALKRGVLLDVGHGSASFSFDVAELAIKQGIYPHTISSDIYCRNRLNGPVHSLATVMSKFFTLGLSLEQVIRCVTENAAHALRLTDKGVLDTGYDADFTIFELKQQPQVFNDSEGKSVTGEKYLVPLAAVVAGDLVLTDEGKSKDVFSL